MQNQYQVEGRAFATGAKAETYARHVALRDAREVHVMEKVDGLPWARCATILPE